RYGGFSSSCRLDKFPFLRLQHVVDRSGGKKYLAKGFVRREGTYDVEDVSFGMGAMVFSGPFVLRLTIQFPGGCVEMPAGYRNVKLFSNCETSLEEIVSLAPDHLSDGEPRFQVPRKGLKIRVGR